MDMSFFKKPGIIGILIAILFIPLFTIKSLVAERKLRSSEAVKEVSEIWGGEQTVTGPVLTIPFLDNENGTGYAHFMPESLDTTGTVDPEKRSRGIYEIIVYKSEITLKGAFTMPDFSQWDIAETQVLWEKAFLSVGISQLQGVQSKVRFTWQNEERAIRHGRTAGAPLNGLHAPISFQGDAAGSQFTFSVYLPLQGAGRLSFTPVGNKNTADVTSSWEHPGFQGRYFPTSREISGAGFNAHWDVSNFAGTIPRFWLSGNNHSEMSAYTLENSAFGVRLVQPVDFYTKAERSVKYALVIITLTFLTFFIFEVVQKCRIHPMQYILVGISLSLFYLLLLSLSEHTGFLYAYILAGSACTASISLYSASFLSEKRYSGIISLLLFALFATFYMILQLENIALLIGSAGLFLILTAVMYITRRIDWYESLK